MSDTTQAPLGAEPVSSSSTSTSTGSTPNTPSVDSSASTSPVRLTPDTMVDIDGKPVKFSDHVRGFQSQATRASQRAAELERKLAEREQAIERYERQQRQGPQGPQGDPLAGLREMPYLDGNAAASIVQSFAAEFNQRDQILLGALKQLQKIQQIVGGLHESSATQSFDAKISGWLRDGGYPDEYGDLAKEIYLAYEGDDLDNEFPRIFAARVSQIEAAQEKRRQVKAEQARRAPFVPGRGGNAQPSKPLTLDPRNSARADAEALWESMQFGSGT